MIHLLLYILFYILVCIYYYRYVLLKMNIIYLNKITIKIIRKILERI